jgi:DNA helicase-2/ATP-dependent DNA helicase PcrA
LVLPFKRVTKNAFEVAELVVKQTRLIPELEKEGTPEAISRVENIQELLNGIKDFITDKIEQGENDSLTTFLEDVALATDFDSDKENDAPKVALMSIHQSKGLIEAGAPVLHYYTMGNAEPTLQIAKAIF